MSSYDKGCLYLIYGYTVKLLIGLFICAELWYLFSLTSNLDKFIENIYVTPIHLIALYRHWHMRSHKELYVQLASATNSVNFDVSTPERKQLIELWSQRNKRYVQLLLALGTCTLGAWYVYPMVDDLEYNLPVAVRVPFEYHDRALYPATYLVVLTAFHCTSYFVMYNDLVMQVYLMHLLCQFTVLGDCFKNIVRDCAKEKYKDNGNVIMTQEWTERYTKRLGDLVTQHQFILSNTMRLKEAWSTPMLFQFMASSLLICSAAYQVTASITVSVTKFLMSLLFLSYNMLELFIFCRWCDEIRQQSENIAEAVYLSGWEGGAAALPGVRGRLLLVIMRARKPLLLTAGGLYDLSLASYGTVYVTEPFMGESDSLLATYLYTFRHHIPLMNKLVKASYSALTMLLRVRND